MELPPERLQEIKEKLIQQINSTFPEEKKQEAINQITAMNDLELIEFLNKNNLINVKENPSNEKTPELQNSPQDQTKSIFRSIVSEEIPSYKIDENKDAIAVLEINPVGKGHAIIIPKNAITTQDKLPQTTFSLAKKIAKKIETKLKAEEVNISSSKIMGEIILNVIPIYKNQEQNTERKPAEKEELEKIKKLLEKKPSTPKARKPRTKKISSKEKLWLPKRIP